jgi:hypothetical protein
VTAARTAVAGACALLAAIALAGCTAELPEQQAARQAVEAHLLGLSGYDGEVHCTRNPRPWFVQRAATAYICAARRDDGDCDWFRVTAQETVSVRLDQERGGCVLPV